MPYVLETEVRYDNSYFAILFESEVEAYKCAAASIKCDVGHMTDSDYVKLARKFNEFLSKNQYEEITHWWNGLDLNCDRDDAVFYSVNYQDPKTDGYVDTIDEIDISEYCPSCNNNEDDCSCIVKFIRKLAPLNAQVGNVAPSTGGLKALHNICYDKAMNDAILKPEDYSGFPKVQEAPCQVCGRANDVGVNVCWGCGNHP
jgi:hypothetical protein